VALLAFKVIVEYRTCVLACIASCNTIVDVEGHDLTALKQPHENTG